MKKYWAKLLIAAVSFAGAVLLLVPICMSPEFKFIGLCQLLGPLLSLLGLGIYLILKMFEKTKACTKFVLLGVSALATIVMVVGAFGFTTAIGEDGLKAEGAMGTAYASYKMSVDRYGAERDEYKADLKILEAKLAEAGVNGTSQVESGLNLQGSYFGMTYDQAIEHAKEEIAIDDEIVSRAKPGAYAFLFTYIAMMISFGVIPLIRASKKVVCHFFCKDECNAPAGV